MTEQEWIECTDPEVMMEFLGEKKLDPRLRRFAVECCRRVRHLIILDNRRSFSGGG